MIILLDNRIWFPHPESQWIDEDTGEITMLGESDGGMIAVGGDLSTERLLLAYENGIFPWFSFRVGDMYWYCPVHRFVIFPDEVHVSHSMRTLMNKHIYRVSFNTAFDQVIRGCSTADGRIDEYGAWLGDDIIDAYTKLHKLGRARSVEVWRGEDLVGGLYGVACGTGFVGESMFSLEPNTSKLALIALARQMQQQGGSLIDCQIHTPHLESLGARFISYKEYVIALWGEDAYHTWQERPILSLNNQFMLD